MTRGLGVIVATVLLASCSLGGGEPRRAAQDASSLPEPTISVDPAPSPGVTATAAPVRLPLDAYVGTAAQADTLNRAHDLLYAKCLRTKGYEAAASTPPVRTSRGRAIFGLTDLREAQQYGYQDPARARGSKRVTGTRISPDLLAAQEECDRGAVQAISAPGDADFDLNLVGTLAEQASQRTRADSRVLAVTAKWRECMKANGFAYESPGAAAGDSWSQPPARPSAREIATAVADVRCKQATNFAAVWVAVEAGYQNLLIDRHAGALAAVKKALNEAVSRAEQVLSG